MVDLRTGRRGFLRTALGAAVLPMASTIPALVAPAVARAAGDFRALVCIQLEGGNDSFNWLVPRNSAAHALYAEARPGLAIRRASLRPVTTARGLDLGLHPASARLQSLFASGEAAFIANCGVLMRPTTKADYEAGVSLPPALFSHSDQSDHWMSARPGFPKRDGWAGRLHTAMPDANGTPGIAMNLSLAGPTLLQSGGPVPAYMLGREGAVLIDAIHRESANYYPYFSGIGLGERSVNPLERAMATAMRGAFEVGELVDESLAATPPPVTEFDADNPLALDLRTVARMIAARGLLGMSRQLFVLRMGGFDTHDGQADVQPRLFRELDSAIGAFQDEMRLQGVSESVTLFTLSEFGRTLTTNGDGTDHGWGAHQLVVGGAVRGGEVYGSMPDLRVDGPQDAGFGRIIPGVSSEQYLGTLARWFGVSAGSLAQVFPNVARFMPRTLGFMKA